MRKSFATQRVRFPNTDRKPISVLRLEAYPGAGSARLKSEETASWRHGRSKTWAIAQRPIDRLGLSNLEHPLQRNQRPASRFVVDLDDIHRCVGSQILETPGQMGQIDAIHRRAHADHR